MKLDRARQRLRCEQCGVSVALPRPAEGERIFDVLEQVANTIDWFAVQHPRGCGALEVRERTSGGIPGWNGRGRSA